MNKKLLKVLDEIDKVEAKLAEWQGQLAKLNEQREQLEEQEIIKAVRAIGLSGRRLAEAVDGLYSGRLTLAEIHRGDEKPDTGTQPDGNGEVEPVSGDKASRADGDAGTSEAGTQSDGGEEVEPASDDSQERNAGKEN